jgi:ubiquinone/menaquinone biosynthesis C-methylase UbiE
MALKEPEKELAHGIEKVRRSWARQARKYDKSMGFWERRLFGLEHRDWACAQAKGDTLEIAVGTGLNLPRYPRDVRLTGIDISPEMLAIAEKRATRLERPIDLREGDAHHLNFPEASFDTVVCTYSLCNIPDPRHAVGEMERVLRPSGKVVLVDHIRSDVALVYWIQKAVELFTVRLEGEHMTRRPSEDVEGSGLEIAERTRLGRFGIVERTLAVKGAAA